MKFPWPDQSIVVSRIIGGLGNQLYQYGAGLAVAEATGRRLVLDRTADPKRRGEHPRPFLLDHLGCPQAIFDPSGLSRFLWKGLVHIASVNSSSAVAGFWRTTALKEEVAKLETLVQRVQAASEVVVLRGHFVNLWAAEAAAPRVRPLLDHWKLKPAAQNFLDLIRNASDPGAVHVRRGDYLKIPAAPVQPVSYYENAIKRIRDLRPSLELFVFSDDPEWARDWANRVGATAVIAHGEADAIGELKLIASCRHFILSDSTFSAWGVRLADTEDSSVIVTPAGFDQKYGFSSTGAKGIALGH
jgi:hypothetical protein